jgi:NTE family protein
MTPPPAPTPIPAPAPESFLTKEPPKVGLILGPGGMKAFAHVGVLKEIARARIPVRGVVGLEWGAVIGGLYSMQGQVNEVEWKSFKLREDDIPSNGLLSKAIKPEKAADLGGFLSTIFATNTIERGKIDFACPAYNIRTERFAWFNKGSYKDVVSRCFAYPPYYTDTDGWLAAPFAIEEAAQQLRAKGANLIIYVNTLGSGEMFNPALIDEHYVDHVLWAEARRQAARPRLPGVNVVININTGSYDLTDYAGRRQLMEAGSRSAQGVINKLVTQYGF